MIIDLTTIRWLKTHYNDARKLAQHHGGTDIGRQWFIISQNLAIKLDRLGVTV